MRLAAARHEHTTTHLFFVDLGLQQESVFCYFYPVSDSSTIINARIECSARTLKELGLQKEPIGYGNLDADPFFCWYSHLFHLNRKKCLLFVNVLTRYPVLIVGVSRVEIRYSNALLCEGLKPQLNDEGVSDEIIFRFIQHLHRPEMSKSKNRSIIGTAVDYERLIRAHLEYSPDHTMPQTEAQMSLRLARTPILAMQPDNYPYKVFSDELLKRYGETGHFRFDTVAMKPMPIK